MERNDDLIRRSALIAEYDRVHVGAPGGARKLMQDAPAVDAVEVVRCKDCKYAREQTISESMYLCEDVLICENPEVYEDCWGVVWYCHFCSYGERERK